MLILTLIQGGVNFTWEQRGTPGAHETISPTLT